MNETHDQNNLTWCQCFTLDHITVKINYSPILMEMPGTLSKTPETLVKPIGMLAAKGYGLNVFNERPISHQSLSLGYLQKLYYIFWFLDVWTVHMFLKVGATQWQWTPTRANTTAIWLGGSIWSMFDLSGCLKIACTSSCLDYPNFFGSSLIVQAGIDPYGIALALIDLFSSFKSGVGLLSPCFLPVACFIGDTEPRMRIV